MTNDSRWTDIRRRAKALEALSDWRSLDARDRDRVLGDLEDSARTEHAEAPRRALVAAIDLLDSASADGSFDAWTTRLDDLKWLIAEVDGLRARLSLSRFR